VEGRGRDPGLLLRLATPARQLSTRQFHQLGPQTISNTIFPCASPLNSLQRAGFSKDDFDRLTHLLPGSARRLFSFTRDFQSPKRDVAPGGSPFLWTIRVAAKGALQYDTWPRCSSMPRRTCRRISASNSSTLISKALYSNHIKLDPRSFPPLLLRLRLRAHSCSAPRRLRFPWFLRGAKAHFLQSVPYAPEKIFAGCLHNAKAAPLNSRPC